MRLLFVSRSTDLDVATEGRGGGRGLAAVVGVAASLGLHV